MSTTLPREHALPLWDVMHLRAANKAAGVALWSWNVDTDVITMDARGYEIWKIPPDANITFELLSGHIHPKDLNRVRADFNATRAIVGHYETDFRILFDHEIRWISARGQGDDESIANRIMFGIFLDVTQRKQAEEANELLAGEMSHRVRNLLTIAAALTRNVSQSADTKEDLVRDLINRLIALGRAHELVHSVPGREDQAALLGDLLAVLLAPYDKDRSSVSGRIRISVPKIGVGTLAATTLALVVHELATNSLKYGALSAAEGIVDISCAPQIDDEMAVIWIERGGPPVAPPMPANGFGSGMLRRGMVSRLGGSIAFDWQNGGVVITLRMSTDRLRT